jgi:hypothetical protein
MITLQSQPLNIHWRSWHPYVLDSDRVGFVWFCAITGSG